jgi:hypothetical protein
MKKNCLLYFAIALFAMGCQEKYGEERYNEIIKESQKLSYQNVKFTCLSDIEGINYFKGRINGEDICAEEDKDTYTMNILQGGRATTAVVDGKVSSTSNISRVGQFIVFALMPKHDFVRSKSTSVITERFYQPSIYLKTPTDTNQTLTPIQMLDKYLKKGVFGLYNKSNGDRFEDFDFEIWWFAPYSDQVWIDTYAGIDYDHGGVTSIVSSHNAKPQTIEIIEYKRQETNDKVFYDVTFKINILLYKESSGSDGKSFGKLENGEFRAAFSLPKAG